MARLKKNSVKVPVPKDKFLAKLTIFFFDRARLTALLWIALTLFGAVSYGALMKREGFPSINFPLAIASGTYFVNDPAKVDAEAAQPITEIVLDHDSVVSVDTQSTGNFFTVFATFEEGADAKAAAEDLQAQIQQSGVLPEQVMAQFDSLYFGVTGGSVEKLDLAISFFDEDNQLTPSELTAKAEEAAAWLDEQDMPLVEDVFVQDPFEQTFNPATNEAVTVRRSFDRFGERQDGKTVYHPSVMIGVAAVKNPDTIKLDEQVREVLSELREQEQFAGFDARVSASFAPTIEENISELQRSLLEGLIAVLVVGSIIIAIRASIITVVSMITVVLLTIGLLYAVGYTLNVITLFALILALALIVDDTIIMVEAIDAARHHHKDRRKAVREATRKVSRAMVAATATAALSFAPLLFVSGILGSFIRAIPVTIISALLISLFVALVFIPFFARQLLLGKKQMGKKGVVEVAAGFEAKIAELITRPMLWARHSRKRLFGVGTTAVLIGTGFIVAGAVIALGVSFNIFPPSKDTNGLTYTISFSGNPTIEEAEAIAARADQIASETLGENFVKGAYFASGSPQNATQQIDIISYAERDIRASELADKLQARFDEELEGAEVAVRQVDVGPPASNFVVQIKAEDRPAALELAADMKEFLDNTEISRLDGSTARFTNASISSPGQYIRDNGTPVVTVTTGFDGDDTSTLVALGETAVKEEFDKAKLASYGLPEDAIMLDIGFESENQESFAILALAFPILLVVMYLLLAVQFRSLLQPLLIFMAIPFSIFGITLGLRLTDNPFSFFAMLGFFALLGLSVKNTILLTDFANQSRRAGLGPIDSAVAALRERFRPLFATSATAVVSLIPLALTSPFWEGLTVVLIFGLLSSTLLVVTVFPYYYLGAEFLRLTVSARQFFVWLVPTLLVAAAAAWLLSPLFGLLVIPLSLLTVVLQRYYARRLVRS